MRLLNDANPCEVHERNFSIVSAIGQFFQKNTRFWLMLSTSSPGTLPHLALLVCSAQYMPSLWLMLSTFHLVPYHNQSQSDCLAHLYQGFDSCSAPFTRYLTTTSRFHIAQIFPGELILW